MTIPEIMQIANEHIDNHTVFEVTHQLFLQPNGRGLYNQLIRKEIPANSYGVYIWQNTLTGEIVYVGMVEKPVKLTTTFQCKLTTISGVN